MLENTRENVFEVLGYTMVKLEQYDKLQQAEKKFDLSLIVEGSP